MLHLGDEVTKVFAVMTLPAALRDRDILGSGQRRFFQHHCDLLSPCIGNTAQIGAVDRFFDLRVDIISCKKLTRESPYVIERSLDTPVAFLAAIAEPNQPMGCESQVITNLFCCAYRDFGQPLIAASRERFEL